MLIGFDLDHTLFDYSKAIRKALLSDEKYYELTSTHKEQLKNDMCSLLGENAWTEFQGILYCKFVELVYIDSVAKQILVSLVKNNHDINIFSHKTRKPILGDDCLLRDIASIKLKQELKSLDLDLDSIYVSYFDSLSEKIQAICNSSFDYFIDDLSEVINRSKKHVGNLIHFNPQNAETWRESNIMNCKDWLDVLQVLKSQNVIK